MRMGWGWGGLLTALFHYGSGLYCQEDSGFEPFCVVFACSPHACVVLRLPSTDQRPVRLIGDSTLAVCVNGCLSEYACKVIDWRPVQGVPAEDK